MQRAIFFLDSSDFLSDSLGRPGRGRPGRGVGKIRSYGRRRAHRNEAILEVGFTDRIIRAQCEAEMPMMCGRSTKEIFGNPRRLLYSQIREDRRKDTWRRVS